MITTAPGSTCAKQACVCGLVRIRCVYACVRACVLACARARMQVGSDGVSMRHWCRLQVLRVYVMRARTSIADGRCIIITAPRIRCGLQLLVGPGRELGTIESWRFLASSCETVQTLASVCMRVGTNAVCVCVRECVLAFARARMQVGSDGVSMRVWCRLQVLRVYVMRARTSIADGRSIIITAPQIR